jgi:integrase/recombinase XerD
MRRKKTVEQMAEKAPPLFHEFIHYLREHQGLNEGTIHNRKGPLVEFFKTHRRLKRVQGARLLKPRQVQRYVRIKSQKLSMDNKKSLLTSLRTFFRFLYFKGYHSLDLSYSVPNVVTYTRAKMPKPLPVKLVQKLLDVPDRRYPIGRRDYAILLLFSKYGVRRKQVTDLLFKDINWRDGTIYFRPMKGGKPILVPMDAEVAKALLNYIKKDRRDTTYPHVFVKHQTGPTGGQPLGRALWFMVSRHLKTAGLSDNHKYRGPHSLRHTVATELLKNKQPLKTIADLLGHRSVSTTMVYTKVDLEQIRKLEKPWPIKEAA